MKSWHTNRERMLIRKYGGKPRISYGTDGTIRGKPVEVRSQRKDRRFRIQKNVHEKLIRQNGYYIFDSPRHKTKKVSARKVSKMLPRGKWYKDRKYPHKFVTTNQVWKN